MTHNSVFYQCVFTIIGAVVGFSMGVVVCIDFVWDIYRFDENYYYSSCKNKYWDALELKCVQLIGIVVVETFLSLGKHLYFLLSVIFTIKVLVIVSIISTWSFGCASCCMCCGGCTRCCSLLPSFKEVCLSPLTGLFHFNNFLV